LVFSSVDNGNRSKTLLASENTQPDLFDEFRSGWWISAVPDRPACDPDGLIAPHLPIEAATPTYFR
jgi:hypothetical protein